MRTPADQLETTPTHCPAPEAEMPLRDSRVKPNGVLPEARPVQEPRESPVDSSSSAQDTSIPPRWRRSWNEVLSSSQSWLASMVVHMAVLLLLALWYLPPLPNLTIGLLESLPSDTEQADDIAELEPLELDPTDLEDLPEAMEVQPETDVVAEVMSFSTAQDLAAPPAYMELAEFGLDTAPEMLTNTIGPIGTTGLTGRGEMSRTALVRRGGGNKASEIAVAMALKWLAEHQSPDGSWSLDHTGGACQGRCGHPGNIADGKIAGTALALLPFLGAGQTHQEGRYQQVVGRGLDALVRLGKQTKDGISWRDGGTMYSHGLAAIALCEAYGMTKDERLYLPAQAATAYIVFAQDDRGGGWRYQPNQPGDTSVVGWQIMALKSGHLAGLAVPSQTVAKASLFLDGVQTNDGARYVYLVERGKEARPPTDTLSAVGLLSRMYIGWKKDNPILQEGIERLAKSGPSKNNYYYNYYAAQVMFQYTGGMGPMWRTWNEKLRDQLLVQQDTKGHARGSWYVDGPHNNRGGRIFTTSLATMTLEVYYRYMPIYQAEAVDEEFPE